MNVTILVGHLGQDPEIRQTASGQSVCTLRLATKETAKVDGQWVNDLVEWHSVVVWGQQAENCGRYLKKGSGVSVNGRIKTREYTDRDGATRRTTEVIANRVEFGERAPAPAAQPAWPAQATQPTQPPPAAQPAPTRQPQPAPAAVGLNVPAPAPHPAANAGPALLAEDVPF